MAVYWRAVIVAPMNVVVMPRLGIMQDPSGSFALTLAPTIGMRPPSAFRLRLFPRVTMGQTSTTMGGEITLTVTPFISTIPAKAFSLEITPSLSMQGAESYAAEATMSVTPEIEMAGSVPPRVEYDAVGTGQGHTSNALSWSHTATAGAYVVVFFEAGSGLIPSAITYGGVAMSSLGSAPKAGSTFNGSVWMYGLSGVAGGAKTVSVTFDQVGNVHGSSVSYLDVDSVGTAQVVAGTLGTSLSQSITGATKGMIVQAFGANAANITATGGGTTRYSSSTANPLIIQDSQSSGSVNFTATLDSSAHWSGIGIVLHAPA